MKWLIPEGWCLGWGVAGCGGCQWVKRVMERAMECIYCPVGKERVKPGSRARFEVARCGQGKLGVL